MNAAFAGAALPLTPSDIAAAAAQYGIEEEAIEAVDIVETGGVGGFLSDRSGRPRILLEAHLFSRLTSGRFDRSHPSVSSPSWNRALYRGGAAEYDRLALALTLDRPAALRACSWGRYQVLGSNATAVGWPGVEEFVAAMAEAEAAHLRAFFGYCQHAGLIPALRRRDWATFARGYNGPGYAANQYDVRLAAAYALAKRGQAVEAAAAGGALRIGMSGIRVAQLQDALRARGKPLNVDGIFGRVTEIALQQWQEASGLVADGIAGPITLGALGVA